MARKKSEPRKYSRMLSGSYVYHNSALASSKFVNLCSGLRSLTIMRPKNSEGVYDICKAGLLETLNRPVIMRHCSGMYATYLFFNRYPLILSTRRRMHRREDESEIGVETQIAQGMPNSFHYEQVKNHRLRTV
ncbi:hypothetical protein LOAG_08560 [Loa loa]|uniref:Uncharacterized protein n=1 Tax=Loa loa TaxID=7209 RepID=A0A1S0TU11_LOALO|nr:hypothetical protein LOAG_08560 [Loa loa]EFO19934.1 hypothetical protein LOAG_08560 [Loa loa]